MKDPIDNSPLNLIMDRIFSDTQNIDNFTIYDINNINSSTIDPYILSQCKIIPILDNLNNDNIILAIRKNMLQTTILTYQLKIIEEKLQLLNSNIQWMGGAYNDIMASFGNIIYYSNLDLEKINDIGNITKILGKIHSQLYIIKTQYHKLHMMA